MLVNIFWYEQKLLLLFIFVDVVLYLQTVLVAESLSERAEIQRQQLLEKLSIKEIPSTNGSYMDMNGRSKGKNISSCNIVFTLCVCLRL